MSDNSAVLKAGKTKEVLMIYFKYVHVQFVFLCFQVHHGYSSSDSDRGSDMTVHTAIHRKRSIESRDW